MLRSVLKCDQQTQGRPGWCRRPSNGRFVYGELGGIKWAEPGRQKTSWVRVRAVAMCSLNGSELHFASSTAEMCGAGWRLSP